MAKRFGRNQRRALRDEIARLESIVYLGCGKAPPGTPRVEDWRVLGFNVSVDDDGRCVDRQVRVTVTKPDLKAFRDQLPVAFQGGLYLPVDLNTPRSDFGRPVICEVTLRGVPAR